ncbi:hypothetical protein SDC9_179131 [bioreactor metagenome]|uniref:Uncharacterized protein n=1 Tax=bioreactor metagenome TaxID=1076179 RepID=A0A645GY44_9ZZZZ
MDEFDRAHVKSPGRVHSEQQPGVGTDFARQNYFLQVASGEQPDRRLPIQKADIVFFDDFIRLIVQLFIIDQSIPRMIGVIHITQDHVLFNSKALYSTHLLAVFGNKSGAVADNLGWRTVCRILAINADGALIYFPKPGNRLHQFALAVSIHAGNPIDFTTLYLQGQFLKGRRQPFALHAKAFYLQYGIALSL